LKFLRKFLDWEDPEARIRAFRLFQYVSMFMLLLGFVVIMLLLFL
jgi:hypothetical protein